MTLEQAREVASFLQERMESRKVWSITVSETRKNSPDAQTKYRVVIECIGLDRPIAIYSARILTKSIKPQGYRDENY